MKQRQDLAFGRLPDEAIETCFLFLGPRHFLYVATTCKRFNALYYKEGIRNKETSYENATWSVTCAKLCLKESDNKQESLERIAQKVGKAGRLNVIKWIYHHEKYTCNPHDFLIPAAHWGRLKVLEWAWQNGIFKHYVDRYAVSAAENEQIGVLDFLLNRGMRFSSEDVCSCACHNGHVTVLDWLKDRCLLPAPLPDFYARPVSEGHINVLDWLHDNNFKVDANYVVHEGFREGQLQVLLWAWRKGMELDEHLFVDAMDYYFEDDVTLLQGLLENECPWGMKIIDYAQTQGLENVVEWAVENGWVERQVL